MLPKVGSIYNIGVSNNTLGAWVRVHERCTLALEAAARICYRKTGPRLDDGGCVGEPHIVLEPGFVFLCILHCCMAIGRLQVAFIEAAAAKGRRRRRATATVPGAHSGEFGCHCVTRQ